MLTRSVLVIEDEAVVALRLSDVLTELDYDGCADAVSGCRTLEFGCQHRPGVALVDVRLEGDPDGLDIARALGAQFDIPSILLSGDLEALRNAHSEGVTLAALNKPCTPEQLESVRADAHC